MICNASKEISIFFPKLRNRHFVHDLFIINPYLIEFFRIMRRSFSKADFNKLLIASSFILRYPIQKILFLNERGMNLM